jgi:hypothetical protein
MKRFRRWWLLPIGLLVVLAALVVGVKAYLGSERLTHQVAARLESVVGCPVEVGSVDVGVGESALRTVALREADGGAAHPPWATADEVRVDLSIWDLLRGETMPRRLTLIGAQVTLHLDDQGKLLTRLPRTTGGQERLPAIHLDRGSVTIHQEGRPEMAVQGVTADVDTEGDHLTLTGTIADPVWGDWTAEGSAIPGKWSGQLTLATPGLHATPDLLERLPWVPAEVWQQVRTEGDTPVRFAFRFASENDDFHWRIDLQPRNTTVSVQSIQLTVTQTQGRVEIDDKVVRLGDVRGQTAGGEVRTSADLDFRGKASRLEFKVHAAGLNVRQLPKSWSLPPQIEGKLDGDADLELTVIGGKIQTRGQGQGVIRDARVAGQPADPIRLRLHAAGSGYQFLSKHVPAVDPAGPWLALVLAQAPPERQPEPFFPAWAVNVLTRKLLDWLPEIPRAANRLLTWGPQPTGPGKAAEPRYLEANLSLRDIDLAQFVKGLGVTLPFPVAGRASFQVRAAFPIDTPRDPKTYRAEGSATATRLVLAGLEFEDVRARIAYRNGVLHLDELHGRVPGSSAGAPGAFEGRGQLQLIPAGELTAGLTLDRIPLARVLSLVPGAAEQIAGDVSGGAQVRVPADRLREVEAWEAGGSATVPTLRAYGLALDRVGADFVLRKGTLSATNVRGNLEGTPISGSADLRLTGQFPFQGRIETRGADLAALERLTPEFRLPVAVAGRLDLSATAQGTLNPLALRTSGRVAADHLRVENFKVSELKFHWDSNPERLALKDLQGTLYSGNLTGSAVWPLKSGGQGKGELRFQDVDVAALTRDVPQIPVRLEGRASGAVEATVAAAGAGRGPVAAAKLDLKAPRLRIQGLPAERLTGTVDYRAGTLDFRLEGDTLGGKFQLDGQYPPAPAKAAEPPASREGHLRIEGARLSRLGDDLNAGPALRSLAGRLDLELTYRFQGPNRIPVGQGRFSVTRLRWGQSDLADRIGGDLLLGADELRLRNLTGTVAGGGLRGGVVYDLRQPNRSRFVLVLEGVDASRLLAPWPALASRVQGPMDARVRGRLGREWVGTAEVTLTRGRLAGVEVDQLRLPFAFAVAPFRGNGHLQLEESSSQVAFGRMTTRASLTFGSGSRLEGQVRFTEVDIRTLLTPFTEQAQNASGRMTGQIDFGGTELRSIDDLNATMQADLRQTRAAGIPVLGQLLPFLLPIQSSGAAFSSGDLRARLSRGIIRIQRLTLQGTSSRLFIEGNITVEGRLNLEVTAATGGPNVNPVLFNQIVQRVPLVGTVPVGLLLQARNLLATWAIHLRVTGTIRSPSIQVEPLSIVSENLFRFFFPNRTNFSSP